MDVTTQCSFFRFFFVKTSCFTTNSLHPNRTGYRRHKKETFREKLKNTRFKGEQGNACLKLIIGRASHFEQILSETRKGGQRN